MVNMVSSSTNYHYFAFTPFLGSSFTTLKTHWNSDYPVSADICLSLNWHPSKLYLCVWNSIPFQILTFKTHFIHFHGIRYSNKNIYLNFLNRKLITKPSRSGVTNIKKKVPQFGNKFTLKNRITKVAKHAQKNLKKILGALFYANIVCSWLFKGSPSLTAPQILKWA